MFYRIFNSKAKSFTWAALLISGSTILSGILGLFRDRLLAGKFGAGEALDIYFAAFRIPDLLQGILVAGGIAAAFLPIFSEQFERGSAKAFRFANNILNCSLALLILIALFLFIFAPQALRFVTPGFSLDQRAKTVILTRIMLLSPILFCLSSIFSGILQYFDRFLVYGLAPILYNLGIIAGILIFVPLFGVPGLALGVILGAILHTAIQMLAVRNVGFHYAKTFLPKSPAFLKSLKLMIPSAIGAGFSQINLMVITALCSTLAPGSIAIFNFSKNFQYLPVGMIGIPFAISAFSTLSRSWAFRKKQEFQDCFSSGLRQILFLTIPVSVLMFILRAQIVRIILGSGLWGWTETRLTAACLGVFSWSIFAFSLIPFFQKSFYSIRNARIPTLLQIFVVIMNIFLSFLFLFCLNSVGFLRDFFVNLLKLENINDIRVIAFPLSLAVSGFVHSLLLFLILIKKTRILNLAEIFYSLRKTLVLTGFMGIGVWAILRPLASIFSLITFSGVFLQLFFALAFGAFIYIAGAIILKSSEFKALKDSIPIKSFKIH